MASKITLKGNVAAIKGGHEVWVNTETDETITIKFKNGNLAWDIYCKDVVVTIEVLEKDGYYLKCRQCAELLSYGSTICLCKKCIEHKCEFKLAPFKTLESCIFCGRIQYL